jgi:RNA polymerase sigma-70 factor (ECF subfamily)
MDQETEAALVARLRAGEHAAFDEVYDAHRGRLYTFLVRLSRSRDVADELIEELWLRLVTHAARLRPDTRVGAWLFAVARNLYLNYCRSRACDASVESAAMAIWPTSPAEPSPFEATAANELERRIERAIAALPCRYREVLLLVGVEGFTPAEAAAVCHVTPEALRQRLSRARAMLAREVDRVGDAPAAVWREARS